MADELIDVSPDWARRAYVDSTTFWGERGKRIDWIKPYSPGAKRAPLQDFTTWYNE